MVAGFDHSRPASRSSARAVVRPTIESSLARVAVRVVGAARGDRPEAVVGQIERALARRIGDPRRSASPRGRGRGARSPCRARAGPARRAGPASPSARTRRRSRARAPTTPRARPARARSAPPPTTRPIGPTLRARVRRPSRSSRGSGSSRRKRAQLLDRTRACAPPPRRAGALDARRATRTAPRSRAPSRTAVGRAARCTTSGRRPDPLHPLVGVGRVEHVLERVELGDLAQPEPAAQQRDLVVAEHDARAAALLELAHARERSAVLGAAVDQIAHAPELELAAEPRLGAREQLRELLVATLDVPHEDRLHRSRVPDVGARRKPRPSQRACLRLPRVARRLDPALATLRRAE